MHDVVIIGAGPAGLAAAVYCMRRRYDVLVVSRDLGGKTNFIVRFPESQDYQVIRGTETVDRFRRELQYLDFAYRKSQVTHIERRDGSFLVSLASGEPVEARAVVIASGLQPRRIDVKGARPFLMKGIGYSSVSYAHLFPGKSVFIVGDGEQALRAALEMATLAGQVYVLLEDEAALEGPLGTSVESSRSVSLLRGASMQEVRGQDYAQQVVIRRSDRQEAIYRVDGIFFEHEREAQSEMAQGLVEVDANGRIITDAQGRSSVPGVFAAGDVTTNGAEQILSALGDGARSALAVFEYLTFT
jgi:thioredoxin reductase